MALVRTVKITTVAIVALCLTQWVNAQQLPPNQTGQKQIETLAVVNGKPLSRHQISTEAMKRFGADVLEDMVNKMLVLDACKRNGIFITEKEVNDQIVHEANKLDMPVDKYIKTITSNKKITLDQMKNDYVWHMLAIRRLAAQQIKVTPEELQRRMEHQFGTKVQVRQIVVNTREQAEQIHAQVASTPEIFEKMAKKFSIDQNTKALGGLLQPVRRNSDWPAFEEQAFALQPGQVSPVFELAGKFFVLRCDKHFPAEKLSQEQMMAVQEKLTEEISRDKLRDASLDLFRRMQESAQIVNVMNDPKLSQQYPGVAAQVNGTNILKKDVAEECITRYGMGILRQQIGRTMLLQELEGRGLRVEPQDLEQEISRAAEAKQFLKKDGTVDVDQWLAFMTGNDQSKVEFYIEDEVWPTVALKKIVESQVKVTEEDMQKGFEANFGPRVETLAIMLNDHRSALKVWNMATANPTAKHFGELAHQYSTEPGSRNNYGQVPPIGRHTAQPELEKEAFSLERGEISSLVQVNQFWIILYCLGRTEPVVTDFDAVKDEIYKDILEKKFRLAMDVEFHRLWEESQIDNFLTGTSQPGKAAVRSARSNPGNGRIPFGNQR